MTVLSDSGVRKCTLILQLITDSFCTRGWRLECLFCYICLFLVSPQVWGFFSCMSKAVQDFKLDTASWNLLGFQSRLSMPLPCQTHELTQDADKTSSFLARPAQSLRKLESAPLGEQLSALLSEQTLSSGFHRHPLVPCERSPLYWQKGS